MKYKVCIQAAGVGSRLTLGKGLHKALIPINNKSTLSRIIDLYPKKTSFVIIVGYEKNQIISFIEAKYPTLHVEYVEVKKFKGKGSGPGYSLLKAQEYLQEPFIFMACDTIVFKRPPLPTNNWIGVSPTKKTTDYLIIESENSFMSKYYEKKSINYINKSSQRYKKNSKDIFNAFIGLAGISDYKLFWQGLSQNKMLHKNERQVSSGFDAILNRKNSIKILDFEWIDTGSDESYSSAKKYFKDNFLLKTNEFLYKEDNKIIKFFLDKSKARKRYERKKYIEDIIPDTHKSGEHFIWYNYVKGSLLSNTNNKSIFLNFLNFLQINIWSKKLTDKNQIAKLIQNSLSFYKDKTYKRVEKYITNNKNADNVSWINNTKVSPIFHILDKIDWNNLSDGTFAYFHGDPQPENVIVKGDNDFAMIDWREDFGGNLEYGDIYYDFGKIYHSLIITQKRIREEKYFVSYEGDFAKYKFSKRMNLIKYLGYFETFLKENNYSLSKVKLISALIYLNIASLHHHPYSDLLFFHGKLTLSELLKK